MTHRMMQSHDERHRREMTTHGTAGVTVRTSLITQLHPVAEGDRAACELLQLLAQSVAEFSALPEIRFIPTGSQSALALISALWPERINIKLAALSTPVPHTTDTVLIIVSANISSESAPLARALADTLLNTVPATTVSRITAVTPPLRPVPMKSGDEDDGAIAHGGAKTDTERSSRLAIGWSVIQ